MLRLTNNQLREAPAALRGLHQLQRLFLGDNQLREAPDMLVELRQLRWVSLFRNQLQKIPQVVYGLEQLQVLGLGGNKLKEIPSDICELRQLQGLYLWGNQLREVPAVLGECQRLKRLFLHGNPDLGIPAEILGPTLKEPNGLGHTQLAKPADILNYYFRPKHPLLEAKLILVGRGAVGKTPLVNRLVHNTFGKEKKTEGIKITGWDVPLPNGEQAHLNVWDFGGQEIMHGCKINRRCRD